MIAGAIAKAKKLAGWYSDQSRRIMAYGWCLPFCNPFRSLTAPSNCVNVFYSTLRTCISKQFF